MEAICASHFPFPMPPMTYQCQHKLNNSTSIKKFSVLTMNHTCIHKKITAVLSVVKIDNASQRLKVYSFFVFFHLPSSEWATFKRL